MSAPLVTVIIPAYKAEKTIRETLESILQQTYQNIEILVVDDGSPDKTADIVQDMAQEHPQIRYIYQENAGVAAARNTAIAEAKGEYIAPMDADDLWHSQRLEKHVAALEEAGEGTALAYSPFYVLNTRSEIMGKSRKQDISGDVYDQQLQENLVGNGSGITVRTDALREVGGYSSELLHLGAQGCEDYLVQMEIAHKYKYVCVPEYLIGYRVYEGNMSSDEVKMIRSRLHVFNHLKKQHKVNISAVRKVKMKFLVELLFLLRRKRGLKAAVKDAWTFIDDVTEFLNFICIMSWGVITRLYNRLRGILGSSDNFQKESPSKEKRKFQDVALSAPE